MPSSSVSESTMKKGTKRKIEIKKRETKQQRSVACCKRRHTVFSKAADLCHLGGSSNFAVFVTSPSESSDVVYSFSGYSSAYEIADCYLNNKPPPKISSPQPKLGFWWDEGPGLYQSCEDLSELNIIEDRILKAMKHVMADLEKEEKSKLVCDSGHNPSTCSLDDGDCGGSSSHFASNSDLNPGSSVHECCGDQTLASFHGDQNPNFSSQISSQIVSFDQNSYPASHDLIYGQSSSQVSSFDTNPSSEIQGGSSSSGRIGCFQIGDLGCESGEEKEPIHSTSRNTNTGLAIVNLDDESWSWNDLSNDGVFCPNNDYSLETTNGLINLEGYNEEEINGFTPVSSLIELF